MHGAPFKPWQGHTKKNFLHEARARSLPHFPPRGSWGGHQHGAAPAATSPQPLQHEELSREAEPAAASWKHRGKRPRGRVLQNVGPVVPWAKTKGSDPAALAWARRIPAPGVTAPSSCCSAPRAAALFGEQAEPVPGWISPLLCLLRQRAAGSFTPCQLWLFSLPVWAFGTGLHLSPRQGPATTGHQHSSPAPTVPPQHLEGLSSALQKKKNIPQTLPSTSPRPDPAPLPPFGQEPPESHCGLGKGPSTPNPSWGAAIGAAPQP